VVRFKKLIGFFEKTEVGTIAKRFIDQFFFQFIDRFFCGFKIATVLVFQSLLVASDIAFVGITQCIYRYFSFEE
jgi:hypothetical protein